MKRFFYVYRTADGTFKIGTINANKYEEAISELSNNEVNVMFLSAYYTTLSRMIYKYISLLFDACGETLPEVDTVSLDFKITKPYLYFHRRKGNFLIAEEMQFGDYNLEFVGYVPNKAFQDLLVKSDL